MISDYLMSIVAIVERATWVTQRLQNSLAQDAHIKKDRSPVTIADYASQVVITEGLWEIESHCRLVAEEDTGALEDSPELLRGIYQAIESELSELTVERLKQIVSHSSREAHGTYWTLDPIDGTKGFLRGANYAIALARLTDGQVECGILSCPKLRIPGLVGEGVIMASETGSGTWARSLNSSDWIRVHCSDVADSGQARILHSYEPAHTNLDGIAKIKAKIGSQVEGLGIDSQAKYALLAAGRGELILRMPNPAQPNYKEKIWDHAAGHIVLAEAGGSITDLQGKCLDFSQGHTLARNTGVLASNTLLHDHLLSALSAG